MKNKLNVIFEDNHIIVVEKPQNIPTQQDDTGDISVLDIVKDYLKIKYKKPGKVFAGLVHRLDRPVGGIMVFARTSKGASRLSATIRDREFGKKYLAVVRGDLDNKIGMMRDFLLKDKKNNKTKVVDIKTEGAKEAILDYEVLDKNQDMSLVLINLRTGRSHQIRVQFSSRGAPLYGDVKYGIEENDWRGNIALWSNEISFPHPVSKENMIFKNFPPNEFPWNQFNIK
jgi:23S rRNA pseudouridine1911/1915/1917 synthase